MFTDSKFCFLRRLLSTAKRHDYNTRSAIRTIEDLLNIEQTAKNRAEASFGHITEDQVRQSITESARKTIDELKSAVKNNYPTIFAAGWALYQPMQYDSDRTKKDGIEKRKKWIKELHSDPSPFFGGDDLIRHFYTEFPNTDVFEPYFGMNLDT